MAIRLLQGDATENKAVFQTVPKDTTYPNGATKTRALNGQAQVRPVTVTTPTGATWSSNCIYYTPNTTDGVKYTTNAVGNLSYAAIDRSFIYEYDKTGNISKITDKTGTTEKVSTYEYDEVNQMNRENNPYSGQTVTYLYDEGGNIKAKNIYDYTTGSLDGLTPTVVNYTYGDEEWKDLLTSYNGVNITYDEIGNPKNYYNGMYFQWQNGRQLKSGTIWANELIMFAYRYNDAGIRTYKNIGGTKTDYFLDGSTIIAQKTGDNTIWYYYDSDGTREAMEYNGNVYYYFYNAQGDVMGLYDSNAGIVALYAYDSWGKVLSVTDKDGNAITDKTHVANVNPFRYRGYYYDEETGFYYLNSRYYDPETGRFINADSLIISDVTTGSNLFTYSGNNPIGCSDSTGLFFGIDDAIAALVGSFVGIAGQGISDIIAGKLSSWEAYVGSFLGEQLAA